MTDTSRCRPYIMQFIVIPTGGALRNASTAVLYLIADIQLNSAMLEY